MIRDCDDFTRQYLVEVLSVPTARPPSAAPPRRLARAPVGGWWISLRPCFFPLFFPRFQEELEPVPAPPLAPPLPRPATPPHTGYGTEADTGYNWNRLVPRPNPRTDVRRWEALDGKALRFLARFARTDARQQLFDAERRFVVRPRCAAALRFASLSVSAAPNSPARS